MKRNKPILNIFMALAATVLAACSGSQIELSYESPQAIAETDSTAVTQALNVYLENSGSMDGYMSAGGTLSDAVYSYTSRLGQLTDTTRLFYINSEVIPFRGNLEGFIGQMTPATFAAAGGNRSASDMAMMIERVLSQTNDSTVTMFVSDCILDLAGTEGTTASRLNNRRIAISNAVGSTLKRFPSLGIAVLKMSSLFTGTYFYPDGRTASLDHAERPYYIWLAGDRDAIALMLKRVPPIDIVGNGFKEIAGFTLPVDAPFEIVNAAGNGNRCSAVAGKYTFYLNANLGSTLQPTYVLADTASYSTIGVIDGLKINRIGMVTRENSPYNVFLELTLDEGARIDMDRIIFHPDALPAWVKESDDTNTADVTANTSRTFGIFHLLTGVSEGFNVKGPLATFEFKITR